MFWFEYNLMPVSGVDTASKMKYAVRAYGADLLGYVEDNTPEEIPPWLEGYESDSLCEWDFD
jgi:hypothetical protein